MTPATARRMHWSEEDYLRMEAQSPIKHEFLDGEVFAMAGAKPEHNPIAASVLGALVGLIRGGRCRAFNSDQRILVTETGLYTYPDGGVACGRWQIHTDGLSLLNPTLLYEVLSPSTRDYDRGAKLDHYRTLSSLRHVLLVDTAEPLIEHHWRTDDGTWTSALLREGDVTLSALAGSISFEEVYVAPEV